MLGQPIEELVEEYEMEYALDGCKHEPFSAYLKALGVLRIVGEQKDKNIRGYLFTYSLIHLFSQFDK